VRVAAVPTVRRGASVWAGRHSTAAEQHRGHQRALAALHGATRYVCLLTVPMLAGRLDACLDQQSPTLGVLHLTPARWASDVLPSKTLAQVRAAAGVRLPPLAAQMRIRAGAQAYLARRRVVCVHTLGRKVSLPTAWRCTRDRELDTTRTGAQEMRGADPDGFARLWQCGTTLLHDSSCPSAAVLTADYMLTAALTAAPVAAIAAAWMRQARSRRAEIPATAVPAKRRVMQTLALRAAHGTRELWHVAVEISSRVTGVAAGPCRMD